MRGVYCLLISLPVDRMIRVGALGSKYFRAGVYVYVGSALAGIDQRVGRHRSSRKKMRWHIDYLLAHAELVASIAIRSRSKETECEVFHELSELEDAASPVRGFGSSDCSCESHLLYFDDQEPACVMEALMMRVSTLRSVYPEVWA